MIYSIIKAKETEQAKEEYFWTTDCEQAIGTILALVTSGWIFVEERKIIERNRMYEEEIDNAFIGDALEWRYLKKYFQLQKKQDE